LKIQKKNILEEGAQTGAQTTLQTPRTLWKLMCAVCRDNNA